MEYFIIEFKLVNRKTANQIHGNSIIRKLQTIKGKELQTSTNSKTSRKNSIQEANSSRLSGFQPSLHICHVARRLINIDFKKIFPKKQNRQNFLRRNKWIVTL